jgi:hypothetical protein
VLTSETTKRKRWYVADNKEFLLITYAKRIRLPVAIEVISS